MDGKLQLVFLLVFLWQHQSIAWVQNAKVQPAHHPNIQMRKAVPMVPTPHQAIVNRCPFFNCKHVELTSHHGTEWPKQANISHFPAFAMFWGTATALLAIWLAYARRTTRVSPPLWSACPMSAADSLGFLDTTQGHDVLDNLVQLEVKPSNEMDFAILPTALHGMQMWRRALSRGRFPDCGPNGLDGVDVWPEQPLFDAIVQVFTQLELPKFTLRHPDLVPLVLKSLGQIKAEFSAVVEQIDDPMGELLLESFMERLPLKLELEWGPALQGLSTLDNIFGLKHGLLGEGQNSFGLHDGIWRHDGWKPMAEVQAKLQKMPELRTLVQNLGRRPSPTGDLHRGPPTHQDRRAPIGVAWSAEAPQRVDSICRSADLARLLPAEMALLAAAKRQKLNVTPGEAGAETKSPVLQRLFLARFAEKRLLTYQLTDWVETRSKSDPRRRYRPLLPRGPGGPLIVCLDTSQSMEGPREQIAKAVVLEAVRAAHVQGRHCVVFAFSGKGNLAACQLDANREGLAQLLTFLSSSFKGGTDVAAPLRQALQYLGTESWAESDILLVSDGELPVPPLDHQLMEALNTMRKDRGLEVHGLLVRPGSSRAMEMICDHIHTFLAQFDPLAWFRPPSTGRLPSTSLRAYGSTTLRDNGGYLFGGLHQRPRQSYRQQCILHAHSSDAVASTPDNSWQGSPPSYLPLLHEAIAGLQQGLVGRDVESRLLLLAVICREHLLLLGPPGTAKSALSRRLASMAQGSYFERLLTRFTTPEELFGPLSLQALEQDLYHRITAGYLPTAEFAFLDEIFKANSAILNALLTLLNERAFDDGALRLPVPLLCAVGASNELPESEELEALYDRFLLRRCVTPVSDDDIMQLLNAEGIQPATKPPEGFQHPKELMTLFRDPDMIDQAMHRVALPNNIALVLKDARIYLRDTLQPGIYVSDRRLFQAQRMLRIVAWVQGRTRVSIPDSLLLQHVLWREPEDATTVQEWLWDNLVPDGGVAQFQFLLRMIKDQATEALAADTKGNRIWSDGSLQELQAVRQSAESSVAEFKSHVVDLESCGNHAFISREESVRMQQSLLPKVQAVLRELDQLLTEVDELEAILQEAPMLGTSDLMNRLQGPDIEGKAQGLTPDQLALSMKEAKAQLSAKAFKQWKAAKRKSQTKRRTQDDEDNDENYQ